VQRARSRKTSLDAPAPQRMTGTAHASGALCRHFSQNSQSQGDDRCRSPSVGRGPGLRFMGAVFDARRLRRVQPLGLVDGKAAPTETRRASNVAWLPELMLKD
jgi:hypothetical protein